MKIGILQSGHLVDALAQKHGEYSGMFEKMLGQFGFTFTTYNVVDLEFPPSIQAADGWLITGSAHGAYDDLEFIPPLEDFIRKAYSNKVPIVGICFGHQIIAQALGGKVEKFSGGWGVGTHNYQTSDGNEIRAHAIHQDQVIERPKDAQIILSSDFCTNAGLAYDGPALTFQPHPEFDSELVRDVVVLRRGSSVPEETADQALASLNGITDSDILANKIGNFFLQANGPKA